MNRADVELLNQSMAGLGNTFMQNRAMAQRANESEMERQLKERMLSEQIQGRKDIATQTNAVREDNAKARQQHFDAEMQHYKNMEGAVQGSTDARQQQLQQRAKEFAHQQWENSVGFFSKQVKDGLLDASNAQTALQKAYGSMPDQTRQLLADSPSVLALQSGGIDWKNPPTKEDRPPAAVATLKAVQSLRNQADDLDEDDPDQANSLRSYAGLLEDSLRKNPPKGLQKTVMTKDRRTGSEQTISGPASDVDAAMSQGPGGPAPATVGPGAAAAPALKFTRDPKTGRLVPATPSFQPALPPGADLSQPLNIKPLGQ